MNAARLGLAIGALLALAGCTPHATKKPATRPAAGAPVTLPSIALVFFHPWSAELTDKAKVIVDQAAAKIKETRPSTVSLAGYTDNDGTPADNLRLANQRVAAVRAALVADGVDPKLFLDIPLGPAQDDAGRTGDRRIEIRLHYDNG
jgi:outer membrane protein OmpA-like peptidoglycan-associated protein